MARSKHEKESFFFTNTTESDVASLYELKEFKSELDSKIKTLPPKCQEVFLLSRTEQLSYKEIALKLNISVNTVDQHIQKALRILRSVSTP